MVIRKGKCYSALSNSLLRKKSKIRHASFNGEIKRIESRGRAINICIDVSGYELNINEDLINEYHTGEQVTHVFIWERGIL